VSWGPGSKATGGTELRLVPGRVQKSKATGGTELRLVPGRVQKSKATGGTELRLVPGRVQKSKATGGTELRLVPGEGLGREPQLQSLNLGADSVIVHLVETLDNFSQYLEDPSRREQILLYLGQVPIFSTIAPEKLFALVQKCEARVYKPKEVVFVQDSPGNDLHLVIEGAVLLIRKVSSGEGKLIATSEEGSSFGEVGFITGAPRNLSAVAGPEGSTQLVLARTEFDELIAQSPDIGFTVFKNILDTINHRMEWLPPFFRNYILWGYRPPQTENQTEGSMDPGYAKASLMGLAGGAAGVVGGLAFAFFLKMTRPELAQAAQSVMMLAAIILGIAGAVAGGATGSYYDKIEEDLRFGKVHPRSCINCKFVVWDENSGKSSCFYQVEQIFQVTFRPGRSFDTFSDCPSFDPASPEGKIKKEVRDTIGKD